MRAASAVTIAAPVGVTSSLRALARLEGRAGELGEGEDRGNRDAGSCREPTRTLPRATGIGEASIAVDPEELEAERGADDVDDRVDGADLVEVDALGRDSRGPSPRPPPAARRRPGRGLSRSRGRLRAPSITASSRRDGARPRGRSRRGRRGRAWRRSRRGPRAPRGREAPDAQGAEPLLELDEAELRRRRGLRASCRPSNHRPCRSTRSAWRRSSQIPQCPSTQRGASPGPGLPSRSSWGRKAAL